MTGVVVDVAGVRVEVASGAVAVDALGDLLVDGPADCSIEVNGHDPESLLADVALAAIDVAPALLLHAGAVAKDGRAVVFPGVSGAGKSTVTAACVRDGLDYVTDELVALDLDDATVVGFGRPLMLTAWATDALGIRRTCCDAGVKQAVPVAELGARVAPGPLVVEHIVELCVGSEASELRPATAGETLALVLRSSFNHFRHGKRAWETASALARRAKGWRLDVADPVDAAAIVRELM